MNIYERAVEMYLTEIEQRAIMPQPWITFDMSGDPCRPFPPQDHSWCCNPDFIIICFEPKQIQMAEVSAAGRWESVKKKTDEFLSRRESIERYTRELLRIPSEFAICLRLFVKKDIEGKLRQHFRRIGTVPEPEITTLEHVFEHLVQGAMPWLPAK